MNNRKYPASLFVIGFITNIIFHFYWLFVPSIIFTIIGIFFPPCTYIGLALLLLDIIASFIEQFRIRQAFLEESDNPDFKAFQDAMSGDGNWLENIGQLLDQKMAESQNKVDENDSDEDE